MNYDVIIVGTGFSGAMIGHLLAKGKKRVLMIEKRNHIAGNMYDSMYEGVMVQKYGPHIFHTNNEMVYKLVTSVGNWIPYTLACGAIMNGKYSPSPFNFKTIDVFYEATEAEKLKSTLLAEYPGKSFVTIVEMLNATNPIIKAYADFLFRCDYEPYTCKQWGVSPEKLDISILQRVPVLLSYEEHYFTDKYQITPVNGYTEYFKALLGDPYIDITLETDALTLLSFTEDARILFQGEEVTCPVVFSGAADALFGYRFGELPYRSLRFEYQLHQTANYQPSPVVAYPQAPEYTRITEYTKLPKQEVGEKTVVAVEYPLHYRAGMSLEPYYPIPNEDNKNRYSQYKDLAGCYSNLYLCGRLAEYRYFNMDQTIEHAVDTYNKIVHKYWGIEAKR